MTRIHYALHKNGDQPSKIIEDSFPSVEAAQNAPVPNEYKYAMIFTEEGTHIYQRQFGWQFYEQ